LKRVKKLSVRTVTLTPMGTRAKDGPP